MRVEITKVPQARDNNSVRGKGFMFGRCVDVEAGTFAGKEVMLHANDFIHDEDFQSARTGDIVDVAVFETPKGLLKGKNIRVVTTVFRHHGKIKVLLSSFGWITADSGQDLFFHAREASWFLSKDDEGTRVEFEVGKDKRDGKWISVAKKIVQIGV